jgi:hypothetical protein
MARHCNQAWPARDKNITEPYDTIASGMSLPDYKIIDNKGDTRDTRVTSIVQNPAGADVAIFKVANREALAGIPITKVGTNVDQNNMLFRNEPYRVSGYPSTLKSRETSYEVRFVRMISNLDDPGADPNTARILPAFALTPGSNQPDAEVFCRRGGMSGAVFVNRESRAMAVLTTCADGPGNLCLGEPVTAQLVNRYETAVGHNVPLAPLP